MSVWATKKFYKKTIVEPSTLSTTQGPYIITAVYAPTQLQAGDIVLSGNTFKIIDTTDPSVHDVQGDAGWVCAKLNHTPEATSSDDDILWGYDEGPTMNIFRAYFRPIGAAAEEFLLSVDGTTTSIEAFQPSTINHQQFAISRVSE